MSEPVLCDANDVGMGDTCCCCGGSASLGGTQHPIQGSVPALRYCSDECFVEWEDFLAERDRTAARRREFERWENALYADAWDGKS